MIDPITASTTFATIVGLIGQFRSERASSDSKEFKDFELWLESNRQTELITSLKENVSAIEGIKELLLEDKDVLLNRLEALDSALTAFASNVRGFSKIAEAINPEAVLSEQAISILQQFKESEASKILEAHSFGGLSYMFIDGNGGELGFDDQQFIEDDLLTLVDLGLLRTDYNSQGTRMFLFTRTALKLVGELNGS